MKSLFFLNFRDPKDNIEYMMKRNPEILFISCILFIYRIIFLIVILANHYAREEEIDIRRVWLNSIGISVHALVLIPLLLEKVKFWQKVHAPMVILSYSIYVFNRAD